MVLIVIMWASNIYTRGNQGLQETNEIEKYHREINLKYRIGLVSEKFDGTENGLTMIFQKQTMI